MKVLDELIIEINESVKNEFYGFVYITHHKSLDKYYIGKKSFDNHYTWVNYLGSGKWLKRAIGKYGKEDFQRHIVALTKSEEESCIIEQELVNKYDATNNEKFYNIHEGGSGGHTIKGYSEEEREAYRKKMRESLLNKIVNDKDYLKRVSVGVRKAQNYEYRKRLSASQRKRYGSEEARKVIGEASKRVWENSTEEQRHNRTKGMIEYMKSEEAKKKQSEKWSGKNNPKYGTTMSEETKAKLAEARKEICSRKTYMYDEQMNLVRVFDRRKEILDFLGVKGHGMLMRSIKNNTLYKGFYWKNELVNKSQTTIERVSMEKEHRE